MATTRVQLNSKTYKVDVFKSMPSLDINKRYIVKVERLTVPAQSGGLILNQPLFTVERRLTENTQYSNIVADVTNYNANVALPVNMTFTPQDVRTAPQLLSQMNNFFRRNLLSIITGTVPLPENNQVYAVPDEFTEEAKFDDWYEMLDTVVGAPVQTGLQAVYRSDGRFGIKFSVDAQKVFVIKLTDEGKRIFGFSREYVAVDVNETFTTDYLVRTEVPPLIEYTVVIGEPDNTDSIICVFDNNIFNHGHYRHELVLRTTLPLKIYLECDHKKAYSKNQLASYRYPHERMKCEYDGTLYKVLKETRKNRYMFEQSTKTHNEFLLTSTQLQNFHVRLMQRNYKWDAVQNTFEISEVPYALPEESLWTLQLAIKPLQVAGK